MNLRPGWTADPNNLRDFDYLRGKGFPCFIRQYDDELWRARFWIKREGGYGMGDWSPRTDSPDFETADEAMRYCETLYRMGDLINSGQ